MEKRLRKWAIALATTVAMTALTAAQANAAKGPKLTVPREDLAAAFHCPIDPTDNERTPLMFVTGTGASGELGYEIGRGAFEASGHPVCYMNFPDSTTADIQVSVEYLVYGLRREQRMARRKVAIFGISQGGLLPRFALTYWPDLRRKVSDVLAAAGTQHGTTVGRGCSESTPCAPANWQQMRGSNLLRALNSQPDETPGDVSYTTVRSSFDEVVQPQTGPHPTSSLAGASNILIQDVCPERRTTHVGTAVDSVSFEAFLDAIAHRGKGRKGAARIPRLPGDVCDHPYAGGLNEATTTGFLAASGTVLGQNEALVPKVPREPPVRKVFKRRAP